MQPSNPIPRQYKVLMSFDERNGCWFAVFWNNDRMRRPAATQGAVHNRRESDRVRPPRRRLQDSGG